MATKQDQLLFELRGFKVYSGRTYKIVDKPDYDAPSGLLAIGATKIPDDSVDEIFGFPFKQFEGANPGEGIYDTGFYKESPCYAYLDAAETTSREKQAKEVLKKYRAAVGNSNAFDHASEEGRATLDKAMFSIAADDILMSDNPKDLMTLYVGLLSGQIANKENQDDPQFNSASYSVIDATQVTKDSDEKASTAFAVITKFGSMLEDPENKKLLVQILNYIGVKTTKDASNEALHAICFNRIANDQQMCSRFMARVDEANTEKGRFKFEIYEKLTDMEGKSSKLVKQPKRGYYYNGISIGVDLKNIAEAIVTNKDFHEIKCELLEIETTTEE